MRQHSKKEGGTIARDFVKFIAQTFDPATYEWIIGCLKSCYNIEAVIWSMKVVYRHRVSSIKFDRARLTVSSLPGFRKKFSFSQFRDSEFSNPRLALWTRQLQTSDGSHDEITRKRKTSFDREKLNRCTSPNRAKLHRSYTVTRSAEKLLAAWSSACVPRVLTRSNGDRCPFYGD